MVYSIRCSKLDSFFFRERKAADKNKDYPGWSYKIRGFNELSVEEIEEIVGKVEVDHLT